MNVMNVFYTKKSLITEIDIRKSTGGVIGFVPTMGALHKGHLELVKKALDQSEIVIVSIFVNPNQFNNSSDLEKYPRMLDSDVALLNSLGDVLIFAPDYKEVYSSDDFYEPIDLEGIDLVLEGKFRTGHFQGVVHVVRNLFNIVKPDKAFFGMKDFQQLAVIRMMTRKLNLPVEIIACDTSREANGLALSSRNLRLSESQKEDALVIYKTLIYLRDLKSQFSPHEARIKAINYFDRGKLKLEYLEIINSINLEVLNDEWTLESTCCIAAYCGEIRLIDNIQL